MTEHPSSTRGERRPVADVPDAEARRRALDVGGSFLVQAPAGSGKTTLLTQRFLKLLARVEDPREIVAITFTRAAAAEMRQRIQEELEKAEACGEEAGESDSLSRLARAALDHGRRLGWALPEQSGWLRVTTIDAFCGGVAAQCPLEWGALNALGGRLDLAEHPEALYRLAARRTLNALGERDNATGSAVAALLAWRDNSWGDVERLLGKMLADRNRWFQDFVFDREPEWEALRSRLEMPFQRAARQRLERADGIFASLAGSLEYALELARLASKEPGKDSPLGLAERAEFPLLPFSDLADAQEAYGELARFLLTGDGRWRKPGGLNKNHGFPATDAGRAGKARFGEFVEGLSDEPGLELALGGFLKPVPLGYSEAEWELLRQCFVVLRRAAAELLVVFAESGSVDHSEVAQIALRVLQAGDGSPSDFAIQFAGGIRHLLVDEFQDTSRKQFELIDRIVAAWPEREGRTCFCVGDPMQSIYGFRESEVELFDRPARRGLAAEASPLPDAEPLRLERVQLVANFRSEATLTGDLNQRFERIFAGEDGAPAGSVRFTAAVPAREPKGEVSAQLHVAFSQRGGKGESGFSEAEQACARQMGQMGQLVALIREHARRAEEFRCAGNDGDAGKYRIAVLGRKKKTLERIAAALEEAGIRYRATALVALGERMEIVDALTLARAALDPLDRTAWLAVLRGPWCGLTLQELHWLTSADEEAVKAQSIPILIGERLTELAAKGFDAARVTAIRRTAAAIREAAERTRASSLGTWLFELWRAVGGERVTDAREQENLRLLWATLDALPNGELDLVDRNEDSGLRIALGKLTAVADPAVSADFGVQLMTIHAAKGLEFEVVIVPELESGNRTNEQRMLAWLERGDAETQDLSEFLIAPIRRKGEEKGTAKAWVEGVIRERETDEIRRLLYVAATRAREELHLFARVEYASDEDGARLKTPGNSLLALAWPGWQAEIEDAFRQFQRARGVESETDTQTEAETVAEAALPDLSSESRKPAIPVFPLRRLKADAVKVENRRVRGASRGELAPTMPVYARKEGGLRVRMEGIAVHRLLQRLSGLRVRLSPEAAAAALSSAAGGVIAEMRSHGLSVAEAKTIADWALAVAQRVAGDPTGAWITAPHREAATEAAWTGVIAMGDGEARLRTLRPDRCFVAGAEPPMDADPEDSTWWIIDYKTSGGGLAAASEEQIRRFLSEQRAGFAGQMEAYAEMLRSLIGGSGTAKVRLGLYYPRLLRLDHWEN